MKLVDPGREPPGLPDDVALVLADPVDPHRNVASALSRRNLGLLVVASGAYLERPSERWFDLRAPVPFGKPEALALVHRRSSHVAVVQLPRPDLVDDTLYPQIRKAERAVGEEARRAGFGVLGTASAADARGVILVVEATHPHRTAVRQRDGPPAGIDRVGQFLEKWPPEDPSVLQGPYVRPDGSLAVETRWEERALETVLRGRLAALSLGKNLAPADPGTARVQPLGETDESEALSEALRRLLRKALPWPDTDEGSARRR